MVFSPSIENCSDIIIMYHQFNGRHFVKETIHFDDKLITVETKENSINYYNNSKDIVSNTSNFEKKVYLKNNIIHSKKVEIEINQNMNRSSIVKKYEAYILPDGKYDSETAYISDRDSDIRYSETNYFCDARFVDKNQKEKTFIYGTNKSTKRNFLSIKNNAEKLINQYNNVKIKK